MADIRFRFTLVDAKETKHMFMSCEENTGQCNNVQMVKKSFERADQFKHLTIARPKTNSNSIHEECCSFTEGVMYDHTYLANNR